MLAWFAETALIATVLAAVALLASRWPRLSPAARHVLWLVVLVKLVAPPLVCWPWATSLERAWPEVPRTARDISPGPAAGRSWLDRRVSEVSVPPVEAARSSNS